MSLLSMLNNAIIKNIELTNNKIGFISYGSGSKAKIFEGVVLSSWKNKLKHSKLFEILDKRKDIDVSTYEDLHRNKIKDPISEYNSSIKLSKIQEGEFTRGLRSYKFK